MNIINKLTVAAAVTCLLAMVGCTKEEEFLKRNTRSLSFPYTASSETFTVRATGDWYISDIPGSTEWTGAYNWVSVDKQRGTGDGVTFETVTVSCAGNVEAERTATIYLQGSGQADVAITIIQANGIFEFTTFINGNKLGISSAIKVGETSNAKLLIPYIKAVGNEKFTITVTKEGGDGLTATSGEYSITAAGDGNIEVPITGTATTQGAVKFSVKAKASGEAEEIDFGSIQCIASAGVEPLIEQDFSGLPWGGDCIAGTAGVWPVDRGNYKTITSTSVETTSCSMGENGLGNGVTSTIRTGNPTLYALLGMTGWTGYRNYMRPGYLQLGTASTVSNEPGSLLSPLFTIPSDANALYVTIKLATWENHHAEFEAGISNSHDGIRTFADQSNYQSRYRNAVTCRDYVNVADIPWNTWVEYSFVLPCNTVKGQSKCVYFTIPESCWNTDGSVSAGRIYIDDIKVIY